MKPKRKKIYESVELHPVTLQMIQKGHPYITRDNFSKKFPIDSFLLKSRRSANDNDLFMINDPAHPKIKARVWKLSEGKKERYEDLKQFWFEFTQRLETSFESRMDIDDRDSYYLTFGEVDLLPGLFIQKLGNTVLVQFLAHCWFDHLKKIIKIVNYSLGRANLKYETLVIQNRDRDKGNYQAFDKKGKESKLNTTFIVNEFGLEYELRMTSNDFGIYLDMSSIRKQMIEIFSESEKVLNLYSYTGAFSLYALKNGAKEVVSVDLSKKYQSWLNENLDRNSDLEKEKHRSIISSVSEAVSKLKKNGAQFDLIVCDPPSFSTDGKKRVQALDGYKKLLPAIFPLLTEGGTVVLFLNTHNVTKKKFDLKIKSILKDHKLETKLEIVKRYAMKEDCPSLRGFMEGDYLKGIELVKVSS